jgi:hypothetical protein
MSLFHIPLTDDAVRRLTFTAKHSTDPRAVPAVGFLLGLSLAPSDIERLRWMNLDVLDASIVMTKGKRPLRIVSLTPYLLRAICAIPRTSPLTFSPPDAFAPSLRVMLVQLIHRSGLGERPVVEFLRWSQAQTPSKRLSTITQ